MESGNREYSIQRDSEAEGQSFRTAPGYVPRTERPEPLSGAK